MQPGSLVECIDDYIDDFMRAIGMIKPSKEAVYVCRGICHCGPDTGIYLEEIINPLHPLVGEEVAYNVKDFRELQPPMDMELVHDLQWYNQVKDLL